MTAPSPLIAAYLAARAACFPREPSPTVVQEGARYVIRVEGHPTPRVWQERDLIDATRTYLAVAGKRA